MEDNFKMMDLRSRAETITRELSQLVYGSMEIRERGGKKYIYVHYRIGGKQLTNYAGEYSEDLYNLITANNVRARALNRELRQIRHALKELGYTADALPENIKRSIDFAKRNLALTIHAQAILEGVATTFAETEAIIEGGTVSGMSQQDITKIINMKHAWEFILDEDIVLAPSDLALLSQINKFIEESFYYNAGKIRDVPVRIGGTRWQPPMPIQSVIEEHLAEIENSRLKDVERAVEYILYIMKSQVFLDGNKRTAVIFANHYLISRGQGLIAIPAEETEAFKSLLVKFYEEPEDGDTPHRSPAKDEITKFLIEKCYIAI